MPLLSDLASWLGPRKAEAEVVPQDAEAQRYLDEIAGRRASDLGPFRQLLYKTIYEKAQAEPQAVTMRTGGLPAGVLGQYEPQHERITLNEELPWYGGIMGLDPKATVTHELLHFLAKQYGMGVGTDTQHEVIDYLLGGRNEGEYSGQLGRPFTRPTLERGWPQVQAFQKRLFEGTPLSEGVMQASPTAVPRRPEVDWQMPDPYRIDLLDLLRR